MVTPSKLKSVASFLAVESKKLTSYFADSTLPIYQAPLHQQTDLHRHQQDRRHATFRSRPRPKSDARLNPRRRFRHPPRTVLRIRRRSHGRPKRLLRCSPRSPSRIEGEDEASGECCEPNSCRRTRCEGRNEAGGLHSRQGCDETSLRQARSGATSAGARFGGGEWWSWCLHCRYEESVTSST